MSKREWLKPIETENVPVFAAEQRRWLFEGAANRVYYCIEIAPNGSNVTYSLMKLELPAGADPAKYTHSYLLFLFAERDGVEKLQTGTTGAARRTVIELRKDVLKRVKLERGDRAAS